MIKIKEKINKKFIFVVFIFITLTLILSNPLIQPLNIYVSSTSLSITPSNLQNGLSLQGSFIVNQQTQQVQATNQTDNKVITAYQISTNYVNLGSIFILLLPFLGFFYFQKSTDTLIKKQNIRGKKDDRF
jgi:hypothetical protein